MKSSHNNKIIFPIMSFIVVALSIILLISICFVMDRIPGYSEAALPLILIFVWVEVILCFPWFEEIITYFSEVKKSKVKRPWSHPEIYEVQEDKTPTSGSPSFVSSCLRTNRVSSGTYRYDDTNMTNQQKFSEACFAKAGEYGNVYSKYDFASAVKVRMVTKENCPHFDEADMDEETLRKAVRILNEMFPPMERKS